MHDETDAGGTAGASGAFAPSRSVGVALFLLAGSLIVWAAIWLARSVA